MPGWNVHLEAGKRLNKKLKFSGKKRKEFLLGCLLPDINNGYVNRVKKQKPHAKTHFAYDQKSSLNFYDQYKKEINGRDPVCLGYLLHLYTDGYFNYNFYHTIKRSPIGEGLTKEEKRKIKHNDFWVYDAIYHHSLNLRSKNTIKDLVKAANEISEVEVTPEEIREVDKILRRKKFAKMAKEKEYIFFNKENLDKLLDSMIESFSRDYLGEKNA